jgi:hypothetical protein
VSDVSIIIIFLFFYFMTTAVNFLPVTTTLAKNFTFEYLHEFSYKFEMGPWDNKGFGVN